MTIVAPKGVRTTHPDYDRLSPYWKDCRNTASGQRAMHAAGTAYIDKLVDETDPQFKARIKRSNFFNGTWRTIAGLKGMAFRVDPQAELPAGVETLAKDITLSGVDLNAFASNIVEEVLEVGRVGVMVDYPQQSGNVSAITVAAAETMGLRPTLQFYQAEAIRNWRFARVKNAWVLAMVTLCESHAIHGDEFGHESEERYRVLDLDDAGHYRQRVFRIDKGGKDELVEGPFYPLLNNAALPYVPFITIGATGRGDVADEPPLIDLVDANVALYQVNSDRRHGLHFTGLPTLFLAGVTQEPGQVFHIGSTAAICSADPQAKGEYIEFTGQGLNPSKDMSLELKQEMAMLGARMLADESRQAETLGGTQIKHQGENSMLGEIVGHVSGALEWALGVFAQWAGASGPVEYQINRQFLPVPMGPQELTALVAAWQSGAVSEQELFAKLQQGEVIDSGKSFEDHQAEAEVSVAPARPAVPANDAQVAA